MFNFSARMFTVMLATSAATASPAFAQAAAGVDTSPTRAGLLKNLDTSFKGVDTNGDGIVNKAEVTAAETKIQQQRAAAIRARIDAEFAKADTNKDGQLSKTEFQAAATPPARTEDPAAVLAQLDTNKDGKITVAEFQAPILAKFDAVDTNKDGTISDAEDKAAAARAR